MTDALLRSAFSLPEGIIYLDGNSLGALPKVAAARVQRCLMEEWGERLIRGWNDSGWIDLASGVGDKIAKLIGAPPGSVIAGDGTSVNLFKALNAALDMAAKRETILSDIGNFPTDLYIAQGVAQRRSGLSLKTVEPDKVADALSDDVAVLMLTQVDYRTGRLHDMAALSEAAHELGIVTVWDLAHSAGALPVDLMAARADFAVGCGYKYLNGGPGAPGFIFVHPEHQAKIRPALSGWFGHEAPFAFDPDYRPAEGAERMKVGTPPILSLAALDAALDLWEEVTIDEARAHSIRITSVFIEAVEAACADFGVRLASPRNAKRRGSQVSFRHEEGYAVVQAMIEQGVIGDFRSPDIMRFGFAPLYNSSDEATEAASVMARVLSDRLWDEPRFRTRAKVT
ncbi:MAG: kynureninase [Geminicoccaceae bacterium]